jgi:serine phosphatase RsbU (regulator of sigma subunit)
MPDQVGGPEKKKYGPARIREIILANPTSTMPQYNDIFAKDFEEYMGENKQVDDVLIIGIEF